MYEKLDKKLLILETGEGVIILSMRVLGEQYTKRYRKSIKLIRINPRGFELESSICFYIPLSELNGVK